MTREWSEFKVTERILIIITEEPKAVREGKVIK